MELGSKWRISSVHGLWIPPVSLAQPQFPRLRNGIISVPIAEAQPTAKKKKIRKGLEGTAKASPFTFIGEAEARHAALGSLADGDEVPAEPPPHSQAGEKGSRALHSPSLARLGSTSGPARSSFQLPGLLSRAPQPFRGRASSCLREAPEAGSLACPQARLALQLDAAAAAAHFPRSSAREGSTQLLAPETAGAREPRRKRPEGSALGLQAQDFPAAARLSVVRGGWARGSGQPSSERKNHPPASGRVWISLLELCPLSAYFLPRWTPKFKSFLLEEFHLWPPVYLPVRRSGTPQTP